MSTYTLTATPPEGSPFAVFSVQGIEVTTDKDVIIILQFVREAYTITATAGPDGSISPSGSVFVDAGASQIFTITPNTGYRIVDVKVDNISEGPISSYTFTNVTANHTISASFAINTYTISGTVAFNASGLAGVTMTGLPGNQVTLADGSYSAIVNHAWTGTVTPTKTGYVFSPSSASYANVASNQIQNYTASLNTYNLIVSKLGTGSGTVTSLPIGINCGPDCSEPYTYGQLVTLTATPDGTSIFAGWSGACSGSDNCTLTMDAAKTVTATFTLKTFNLTIQVSPSQGGFVSPSGGTYDFGTVVSLTATPVPVSGYRFDHWEGALTGSLNPAQLTMDGNKSVTAFFTVGNSVHAELSEVNNYSTNDDTISNIDLLVWNHQWFAHIINTPDNGPPVENPKVELQTSKPLVGFWPNDPTIFSHTPESDLYTWKFNNLQIAEPNSLPGVSAWESPGTSESPLTITSTPRFSASRSVAPDILTQSQTKQTVTVKFKLEEPLPGEVNSLTVIIGWEGFAGQEKLVVSNIVSQNQVDGWNATTDTISAFWGINPSNIQKVGNEYPEYTFIAKLNSVKSVSVE
jgi:hypothetical protein